MQADQIREIMALYPQLSPERQAEVSEMIAQMVSAKETLVCQDDFLAFVRKMWPGFVPGAHHKIIANAFERIARGELKRVCISLPPRSTKSELSSYLFPAWFLGKFPNKQIIQASHKAELAVGFGRKVRNLVGSEPYREVFADVGLRADSKAAGRWNTTHGGVYMAAGVGAGIAGFGADLVVIDDPHDEQEAMHGAHDPEVFAKAYDWYVTGPRQRLQPGAAICIIATRWSKLDLIGRVLAAQMDNPKADQWEVIEIPALLPSGASYWPEYWPLEELLATQANIPPVRWNAQYMQALAMDTPIPTPSGWTTMADIRVGDEVIGSSGRPVRVIGKSEVFRGRPSYRVSSDDGACVVADEDHLWTVKMGRNDGKFFTKTTKRLALRQAERSARGLDPRRPRPPEVPAWSFPEADLPLDPYVLGVWLGDGNTGGATINAHEDDQVWLRAELERCGFPTTDHAKPQSFGVLGGLRTKLREMGVLDRKMVPPAYLRASAQQRLSLLQGLMDTDGTVSASGQCYFAQAREDIADAVYELVLSLGGKPFKRLVKHGEREMSCGRALPSGEHWRVFFYLPDAFRMPRKLARCRARKTKIGRFLSFESIGPVDTVCIRVDAEDGIFLAGRGCLPTHNSPTAEEGALIKREWWNRVETSRMPRRDDLEFVIQSWDTAHRISQRSDFSVCTTWGVSDSGRRLYLMDVHKERMEFPELKAKALELYKKWEPDSCIIEGKAAGDPLIQELRRMGIPIASYTPSRGEDKMVRVNSIADVFSSGMVYAPETRWADELIEEFAEFPYGTHDDQVDSSSLALMRYRQGNFLRLSSDEYDEEEFAPLKADYY